MKAKAKPKPVEAAPTPEPTAPTPEAPAPPPAKKKGKKEFDDKNEINKARNSPFKDYVITSGSYFGSDWTSPWTNSRDISRLVQ